MMCKAKSTILQNAVVINTIEDEHGNLIKLWFQKGKKRYQLEIKGFEAETVITEIKFVIKYPKNNIRNDKEVEIDFTEQKPGG